MPEVISSVGESTISAAGRPFLLRCSLIVSGFDSVSTMDAAAFSSAATILVSTRIPPPERLMLVTSSIVTALTDTAAADAIDCLNFVF